MLIRLLCRKMIQKETPDSPMIGGQGVEVSKTLFYLKDSAGCFKISDFLFLVLRYFADEESVSPYDTYIRSNYEVFDR